MYDLHLRFHIPLIAGNREPDRHAIRGNDPKMMHHPNHLTQVMPSARLSAFLYEDWSLFSFVAHTNMAIRVHKLRLSALSLVCLIRPVIKNMQLLAVPFDAIG